MIIKNFSEVNNETLKENVIIRKKINGHKFSFRKERNGTIKFFGKKQRKNISIFDRLMSDLYEKPIHKILSSGPMNLSDDGTYFTYFNNDGITLTAIRKLDVFIDDENVLREYASQLNIDYQRNIFNGVLNEQQIDELMNGEFSFLESENKTIDGIILSFADGNVFKVKKETLSETYEKHDTTIFEIATRDIIDFILNVVEITKIPLHDSKNREIRFIDLCLKIFKQFIQYSDIEVKWPKFLENAGSINRKYITDIEIKKYIQNNKDREYLLRIFLLVASGRIKAKGLITDEDEFSSAMIFSFLKDYVNSRGIIDFNTFKKIMKK